MHFIRNIFLIITIFLGHLSVVHSQENILDDRISFRIDDKSVKEALQQFSTKTEYRVSYSNSELPLNRTISKAYENESVSYIIRDIWGDENLIIRAVGNSIIIKVAKSKKPGKGKMQGRITDDKGEPLPGVTVQLLNTRYGAVTDVKGDYEIRSIPVGEYRVEASYLGFKKNQQVVTITASKSTKASFIMTEAVGVLEEIVVRGKTEAQEKMEQPIKVDIINMAKFQTQPVSVPQILNRTTGVRIRQAGGLGSPTQVQLNGLSGAAVRQYYDGIPLEFLNGGITINNLPTNAIDNIEIYKGVVPIEIGTDALAGGINIVPKEIDRSYADMSYEFGSFNTHIATVNGAQMLNDNWYIGFNGFFNYSDNDYSMRNVAVATFETFINTQGNQQSRIIETVETVDRFHDVHQSSFFDVQLGAKNLKWADKISISTGFSQRFDEIQTGQRITARPTGEAEQRISAFFQTLKYEKEFKSNIQIKYNGNYAIINEQLRDSTINLYNWFGEIETEGILLGGAEILREPTLRDGETFSTTHRLTGIFNLSDRFEFVLNNFFAYQRIVGEDPAAQRVPLDNPTVDPNTIPSSLDRNILAAQLDSKWLGNTIETSLFGKFYSFSNKTSDFNQESNSIVFDAVRKTGNDFGFGGAIKLVWDAQRYLRVSYENAIRVPSANEVFGDFIVVAPNFLLRPEQSENLNIGLFYRYDFSDHTFVSLQVDWFLRDLKDLIRLDVPQSPNLSARFINQAEVESQGVEIALKMVPLRRLDVDFSFTFQDIINSEAPNANNTNDSGKPIPNIPRLFYNVGLGYRLDNLFGSGNELAFFGNYTHIDEFSLIFEGDVQNDANFIPVQGQTDVGLSYRLPKSGLTFSFQLNNLTDADLFDNFRLPKPGRNYRFKIRYEL
ncbi:MAG: TonB-dependent receptor [Bacteroidota bacterium]